MGINFLNFKEKEKQIPQEFKKIAKDFSEKGFVTTSSDNLKLGKNRFFTLDDIRFGMLRS